MYKLVTLSVLLIVSVSQMPVDLHHLQDVAYTPVFDGSHAYEDLITQCTFGPRPPGSENLSRCRSFIVDELRESGWVVILQNFSYRGINCTNVIAKYGNRNATIIVGSHYDTRPLADHDPYPANRTRPILGANDGASSTGVLLELARALPESARIDVELVFFDAEDSGNINGWEWIVGSTYYVGSLSMERREAIRAMILLDMVGDAELTLLRETSSTKTLQDMTWSIAAALGYDNIFIDGFGASILDDHRPFLDAGIPAVDIIQHAPFPWYWHTVEDTPDKCSATSLETVGQVVECLLVNITNSEVTFTPSPLASLPVVFFVLPPLILAIVILWYRRH